MNDSIAGVVGASTLEPQQEAADTIALAVLPPTHRRPRVREVSSRFMSPVVSSSFSSGDLHLLSSKSPLTKHPVSTPIPAEFQARQQRSKSVLSRRLEQEPLSRADQNISETIRSLDTPLGSQTHSKAVVSVQRKQRAAVNLFKENGGDRVGEQNPHQQKKGVAQLKGFLGGKSSGRNETVAPSRPDTPTLNATDRIIPSRYRLTSQNFQRPTNISGAVTAATKLLRANEMSLSTEPSNLDIGVSGNSCPQATFVPGNHCTVGLNDDDDQVVAQHLARIVTFKDSGSCTGTSQLNSCSNSPVPIQKIKACSLSDLRSSLPEVDMLPTVSTRLLEERSCSTAHISECESSKFSASSCFRSLTLPLSSSEHSSLLHSLKSSEKTASALSRASTNSSKMRNFCLPPHPTCIKGGADTRKGRTVLNHPEEVHSLKLLHNHYLQWRYANAKAEASMHAQRRETERELYSLATKILDLHSAVTRRRIEIGLLQRVKTLSAILEAHIPYLDQWSAFEEEYSTSLSGASSALLNFSLQLPVSGNVRADMEQLGKAMNSATKVLEMIGFLVQSFMPKVEEMDTSISELARVTNRERAFIEECGDLVFGTFTSQVEECSLRGHLIQSHSSNHAKQNQPQEE
ncbi:unnamed protein product [Ilex paraguariensis]|uniref:Protein ENDOSPERM DEFECTIVE 1 n=1 Tax=Ilex paraguariensis TaxID=185542 RepID=A0ABC8U619_9AQUA